jgi:protoporphyrin/coproporphyrin ferrochelatase
VSEPASEPAQTTVTYDAIVIVSFGGPEGPEDVLPFMENVTRGRGIPRERLVEVSAHYQLFGGVSPINAQNRALIDALRDELDRAGIDLPIYWGNRNWHPFLADTVRQMRDDGVQRALAFVTSAYSSYSGCRQYREDIAAAIDEAGPGAPSIDKLRVFFNHPGFIEPMVEHTAGALAEAGHDAALVFTAHSIPCSMADTSDYAVQLREAARLVSSHVGHPEHALVFQSRSGPPSVPWLEPDVNDHLRTLQAAGREAAVLVPIGFISDHMEVVYDLDTQAQQTAAELGMTVVRAATVGTHPRFVAMIRELVEERLGSSPIRRALGLRGPNHDVCPAGCCPAPAPRR